MALTNVSIPKKWVLYPPHKFFPKKKKNSLVLLTKSANHNACKCCIKGHPFDPVWFFELKFVLFLSFITSLNYLIFTMFLFLGKLTHSSHLYCSNGTLRCFCVISTKNGYQSSTTKFHNRMLGSEQQRGETLRLGWCCFRN